MHDVRWFAPNHYCALPVERLRARGLSIALEGNGPARLTFLSDATLLREAFRFARRHRAPMVANIWDVQPWQVAGGKADHVIPLSGRLVVLPRGGHRYPGRPRYYSRVRYVIQNAREVWAPSQFTVSAIREWAGRDAEHLPYCYDSDRYHRAAGWRRPPGSPVVLSISRLAPHKNHRAVIRAAALSSSRPRVRIIGRGEEAANLRTEAALAGVDLELDERWLSDDEILAAYLHASAVVCPSRFEGIGVTPLESAALGIPTVAADIPAHREFAAPGVDLVPLDDDSALAAAIDRAVVPGAAGPNSVGAACDLTIEACAVRIAARFELLLGGR